MANLTENGYLLEAKTKVLTEKWSKRISLVESTQGNKPMGLDRKAALAKVLENTQQFLKSTVVEGVQSSDIGQYKRFALDLVTTMIPNLIAYDLVSVQPIENRVGMINYIKYVYGTAKGATAAGQEYASALNFGTKDPNYTTKNVLDEAQISIDAVAVEFNLAWKPVLPGTVTIKHGDIVITDNGQNVLTAVAGLAANGTIDYATGAVAYTLSVADDTPAVATYQYNNEYIPAANIPDITLKIVSLPIVAETRRLKAYYAFEAAFELQKEYGHDMQELLNAQAAADIAHEIDIEICNDLYRLANAGNELTWSKAQPMGVSLIDHYDSLLATFNEGSNAIHQATKRVHANFVVVGTAVAAVLESTRNFVSANATNVNGPYYAGTIGRFKAYVNPEFGQNEFVMGYKGDNLLHSGYVYAPYMPILTTDLVQLEDMAGRKGWATMYGKRMLNDKMFIKGRITA